MPIENDLQAIWNDIARRFAGLPEWDSLAEGFDWAQVKAAHEAGNELLRYCSATYGADINLDPDDTFLKLRGVKARAAYGSIGVIRDWLRFASDKLGIDFYNDTRWMGHARLQHHNHLIDLVATRDRVAMGA